ncbi:MAG: protein kinase, partial [bacterium]|nr:protein kinase [bacterium]
MIKAYISSTYVDLKKEREAAAQAVRRLGHQAIAMEDYVASDRRPADKCLHDVKRCDVYVGIFAWRYGYILDGYDKSITHLEHETAQKAGIPCLIFLTDNKATWPVEFVTTGEERKRIDQLRNELLKEYNVSFFKNADELSGLVSAAMSNLIFIAERSFDKFKRPEELIGTKLGKYVIREKLGRGGKGIVLKVRDTLEERAKAVKIVPPRIADSPVAFEELKREVNTAACIIHPNVVKVLGLEEHEGQFFIVMEYIEGKSLEQILADSKEGKLKETEVIDIMKKLARGLLETHKNNVVHRDIKPSNVMVTPGGQVKILDFGISYRVTKSMTELAGEHQGVGTWPYMAPEQLSTRYGRENKQVDIWGFGVTMYQLLAGKLPFINKDQIKDKNEKPYDLEGVSGKMRNIVMKCLEKDRKKRFQNMEETLSALNAVSKGKVKEAPRMKWILAAASIIALIVLSVFFKDKI